MKREGTILVAVIIILVFLAVMGMSLLGSLFSRLTISMLNIDRLKAFYLAEAGIAKSIVELHKNIDPDHNGVGNISVTPLGDGRFWAEHDFQTSTITSTGEVNKVKRVLQVKYTIF